MSLRIFFLSSAEQSTAQVLVSQVSLMWNTVVQAIYGQHVGYTLISASTTFLQERNMLGTTYHSARSVSQKNVGVRAISSSRENHLGPSHLQAIIPQPFSGVFAMPLKTASCEGHENPFYHPCLSCMISRRI